MKCDLKGMVNMKLQEGEMVKLNDNFYIHQEFNNIMSVLRLISEGAKMGGTKYNTNIKKNGVKMILDTIKIIKNITMIYFKAKRYAQEGSSPQEANRNLQE